MRLRTVSKRGTLGFIMIMTALSAWFGAQGSKRPQTQFVQEKKLQMFAAPSLEGAPALADLRLATPVNVAEERDGWSRVVVWGWVPSSALSDERPSQAEEAAPSLGPQGPLGTGATREGLGNLEPDLDDFGRPIQDIQKASRITVSSSAAKDKEGEPIIGVSVGLTDPRGRMVSFEEPEVRFDATLWEKRAVGTGHTRGKKLYSGEFVLEKWQQGVFSVSGRCRIPLSALNLDDVESKYGILVVKTTLPGGRRLYGRDYDVPLEPQKPAGDS